MADHRDTPDPLTDITDLFAFQPPGGGDRSVLVLDINPDASAIESSFDPAASYELKIDTDGDYEADVAPTDPGGYPNGRRLTDDIVDLRIAMATMGRVMTDGVGPHTDLLDGFPYLGALHAMPA